MERVEVLHQRVPTGPRTSGTLKEADTTSILSNSTTHITYGELGHISVSLRIPHSKKVDQTAVGTCWTVDGIPFLPGWITRE